MKYYLIENNFPIFELDINNLLEGLDKETFVSADFILYRAVSWISEDNSISEKAFVACVHFKWDWCTHWNFYGMDYDPEYKDNDINPAYYHICGSFSMTQWIKMFAFVRTVMLEVLGDRTNDYSDEDKELDKMLLKDYTIRKEE